MKINYQAELEKVLCQISAENTPPKLLLHACCAPCSSYVLEYLTEYFDITVYFYNPNITDAAEYKKRAEELSRLISLMPHKNSIGLIICDHSPECFYDITRGLEKLPEGSVRCFGCYKQRLDATARYMKDHVGDYDYFATTLTVSPHKNAAKLNELGAELADEYGVKYLPSDFKKREGYKRSIELSREYSLYRQDFCGCEFSRDYKYGNS
ncbi:MAG: epoxyqueuosine reductase QueH [Clostridia bacterium]|nr:epoxyqueuosine reductase QueH [Clostridia bacterium]